MDDGEGLLLLPWLQWDVVDTEMEEGCRHLSGMDIESWRARRLPRGARDDEVRAFVGNESRVRLLNLLSFEWLQNKSK